MQLQLKSKFNSIFVSDTDAIARQLQVEQSDETYLEKLQLIPILRSLYQMDYNPPAFVMNPVYHKEKSLVIPIMNEQLVQYFPQQLENQWTFRQRYLKPIQQETIYLYVINLINLQIDDNSFEQDEIILQRASLNEFQQFHNITQIRFVTNYVIEKENDMNNILILHDFYHHPLLITDFVSSFRQQNVILPYLPDISAISDKSRNYLSLFQQLLYLVISFGRFPLRSYSIVAMGISACMALKMQQQQGSNCNVVLCSPILNILEDSHYSKPIEVIIKTAYNQSEASSQQSFTLDDITNIESVNLLGENYSGSDTIQCAYSDFSRQQLKHKTSISSQLNLMNQTKYRVSKQVIQKEFLVSNDIGNYTKLETCTFYTDSNYLTTKQLEFIRQSSETMSFYNNKVLKQFAVQQNNLQESVVLINDIIRFVFEESQHITQKLLHVFQQKSIEDLHIPLTTDIFQKLYFPFIPLKIVRKKFMSYLFGLTVLSPMSYIDQYRLNEQLLNTHYFKFFSHINCLISEKIVINSEQKIVIILGSHDTLINKQQLKQIAFLEKRFPNNIYSRTLYGVSHELYTRGSNIIQSMMQHIK